MITDITIENFKGFRDRVRIDLKPLTLLFGANSAGKSTIIQAIEYYGFQLRSSVIRPPGFFRGDEDDGPDASFWDLVHGHDRSRSITIGLGMAIPPHEQERVARRVRRGPRRAVRGAQAQLDIFSDLDIPDEVHHVRSTITVSWNDDRERAVITQWTVDLNDEPLLTNVWDEDRSGCVRDLNLGHALLLPKEGEDGQDFAALVRQAAPAGDTWPWDREYVRPIGIGALVAPALSSDHATEENGDALVFLIDRIERLTATALAASRSVVNNTVNIGPIRSAPPRDYLSEGFEGRGDWGTGVAAWRWLDRAPEAVFDAVGEELTRLGLGYGLTRVGSPEVVEEVLAVLRESAQRGGHVQSPREWQVERELKRMLATPGVARSVLLTDESG